MPQEYSEGALNTAYNNAANEMGPMSTQIAVNGQMDTADRSIIHTSSTSPLSFLFGCLSWGEFPYSKFSMQDEEWHSFFVMTAVPAIIVAVFGICMCIWLVYKLVCWSPKQKKLDQRPSTWHLKWTTISGFLILWICVGICVGRGRYAYDLIYNSVVDLQPDVNFLCGKIGQLQPGFHNAAIWMKDWQTSCVGWSALDPLIGDKIREVNANYTSYVDKVAGILYELESTTNHLPNMIESFKLALDWFLSTYKVTIGVIVFLPTVLASILVAFIVSMTLFEGGSSPRAARMTNFLVLDLGAAPMVIVILTMTVISAGFMYVGTGLGGFCWEPNKHTVDLVSAARNGTRTNKITTLVGFYIEGHPQSNTIVETLRTVEGVLTPVESYMWIITPALDLLGLLCHRVGSADISSLIGDAIPDVKRILPISKRDRVYSHYNEIVVRGICGQLTSAIGWYMICQIICGMVLLPIIAVESHKYLSYVSAEAAAAKKLKEQEEEALISKEEEAKTQHEQKMQQSKNFWSCCTRGGGRNVGISPGKK